MSKKKNTKNELKEEISIDSKDSQIKSLLDEVSNYKSLAQRSQADLVNFRKRVGRSQFVLCKLGSGL